MKIEIPVQFENIELSDREKIMAWVMVQLSRKMRTKNWGKYTYVLHKRDVNHILKRTEDPYLVNLRKVFDIGVLNRFTIAFSWKKVIHMSGGPGMLAPKTFDTTIEDPHFFIMYSFLLGRMVGDSNIFNEDEETVLYESTTTASANQLIHRLYKSYYGDELHGDE
jgi:hypothetical protein